MDYSKFKVPRIPEPSIKEYADSIRKKYWGEKIPVDVEKVMEFKFNLTIIPLPGLNNDLGVDSFISSNWDFVYVDNDNYLNDATYKRVRFSFAHELGHLILHKQIYESLKINSVEKYYKFYENAPGDHYSYLETQANHFAGHILVPRDRLRKKYEELKKEKRSTLAKAGLNDIEDKYLIDYMAEDLADTFEVSSQTMEICLNKITINSS